MFELRSPGLNARKVSLDKFLFVPKPMMGKAAPVCPHLKLPMVDKVDKGIPARELPQAFVVRPVEFAVEALWAHRRHLQDVRSL